GRLLEHAQAIANVLAERLEEGAAHGVARLLLVAQLAAELEPGTALGFGARETGPLQVVGAVLDVRAQLRLDLLVHAPAAEEPGDEAADVCNRAHVPSGWAARTVAIAVASRFQPSVSSRNRPRPAAVSS